MKLFIGGLLVRITWWHIVPIKRHLFLQSNGMVLPLGFGELAEDVAEDAAVLVVENLLRRVDA